MRRNGVLSLTMILAGVLVVAVTSPASATNLGSKSGVNTVGCDVSWDAATVMNTNLQNDDPEYPNLMKYPDGSDITSYSNGGYITEVRPETGGPGMFEITHWYAPPTPSGDLVASSPRGVYWRIPISTDAAITGATLTVTLPRGDGFTVTSGQNIGNWGTPYSDYTWTDPMIGSSSDASGLHWTFDLGDLAASSGVVIMLSGTVPTGTVLSENSVATASLTGTYGPGSLTCQRATTTTETTVDTSTSTTVVDPVDLTTTTTTTSQPSTNTTVVSTSTAPPTTSQPSGSGVLASQASQRLAQRSTGAAASKADSAPSSTDTAGNAAAAPRALAVTGRRSGPLSLIGVASIGFGLALLALRRRRA